MFLAGLTHRGDVVDVNAQFHHSQYRSPLTYSQVIAARAKAINLSMKLEEIQRFIFFPF